MEPIDILNLVARWLHILSAITALGGAIFARFAVHPGLMTLPEQQRMAAHTAIRARWAKFLHASFGLLLLTGLYNYATSEIRFALPMPYRALFGVKFLLALVVIMFGSMLVGRSPAAERLRQNSRWWLGLIVLGGVTIVALSGILRSYHTDGLPVKVKGRVETSIQSVEPDAANDALSTRGDAQ